MFAREQFKIWRFVPFTFLLLSEEIKEKIKEKIQKLINQLLIIIKN